MLYFENLPMGRSFTAGPRHVTEAEIIAYATQFDPQPFHTDPEAGRAAGFDGVIASGWHTGAITMRLIYEAFIADTASLGASSVPVGNWLLPVRAGDDLSLVARVLEARPSRSKPDRGILRCGYELSNQAGQTVYTMEAIHFVRRRVHAGEAKG